VFLSLNSDGSGMDSVVNTVTPQQDLAQISKTSLGIFMSRCRHSAWPRTAQREENGDTTSHGERRFDCWRLHQRNDASCMLSR